MKNFLSISKHLSMVYFSLLVSGALMLGSCDDDDDTAAVDNTPYTVSGAAAGSQVVPSVAGNGTGTFSGTYNPSTRVLNYNSNWTGLSGAPSSAGFYSGASGSSGTAVGSPWTIGANATGTGNTSGTMTLTNDQVTQMLNGNWYYSYGTTANPGGEVRGQMSAIR